MKQIILVAMAALLALAGCSKQSPQISGYDTAEEAEAPTQAASGGKPIEVAVPQIAYTYTYGFVLPEDSIAAVQRRHIALCDRLGVTRCRILDMQSSTRDGSSTGSTLKLSVDARLARSFSASLDGTVERAGGTQSSSSITAEDLSKQIVDTEAHLRAKQALADRLMALLKTRNGPVADLVAAERSVASVQEEIDTARSWLVEARGRVAMSTFELSYAPDALGGGFIQATEESFAAMSDLFVQSVALMILLLGAVLPWAILGAILLIAIRYVRRRLRQNDVDE